MTVNDFLKEYKPVLKVMVMNGLSLDLGRCAGMVEVYKMAKAEHGAKYAVEVCKSRYSIKSNRHVFRIINTLKRDLP